MKVPSWGHRNVVLEEHSSEGGWGQGRPLLYYRPAPEELCDFPWRRVGEHCERHIIANSRRMGQVVKTAGDAGEGSSSQLFLTLASLFLPMDSGSPLPTLDPLFLTPPHSLGEGQWDEAGELRPAIRCGQALVSAEMTWVSPCVPPSVFRTTFSGKRSTLSTAPMKGEGRFTEKHHWDIFLGWLC